jgi:hypothetical protein
MQVSDHKRLELLIKYYGEGKLDALYSMSLHIRQWIRTSDELEYPAKDKIEWLDHFKNRYTNPKQYLRRLFLFHKLRKNWRDDSPSRTKTDNRTYEVRGELIRFLYNSF